MLEAVSLKDASSKLVVPSFANKKAGQTYAAPTVSPRNAALHDALFQKTLKEKNADVASQVLNLSTSIKNACMGKSGAASSSSSLFSLPSIVFSSSVQHNPQDNKVSVLNPTLIGGVREAGGASKGGGEGGGADGSSGGNNSMHHSSGGKLTAGMALPSISETLDVRLPHRDNVCQMYCVYAVVMAVTSLVLPYYTAFVAQALTPLFVVTVLSHCMVTYVRWWHAAYGVTLCALYPLLFLCNSSFSAYQQQQHCLVLVSVYAMLFMVFCLASVWGVAQTPSMYARYVHWSVLLVLSLGSVVGVLVLLVFPRSVHGLHATFLALTALACATLLMVKKKTYKIVCETQPVSLSLRGLHV